MILQTFAYPTRLLHCKTNFNKLCKQNLFYKTAGRIIFNSEIFNNKPKYI